MLKPEEYYDEDSMDAENLAFNYYATPLPTWEPEAD